MQTKPLALVIALMLIAPLARADAVAGPPACPPGARGQSSHSGQWCEPWPCTSDAQCESGSCRRWRVCTRVADVPFGGHRMFRPGEPTTYEAALVVGTCDPSRACTGTEEPPPSIAGTLREGAPSCTEATYCVPSGFPELPPREPPSAPAPAAAPPRSTTSSSSGGCSIASGSRSSAGIVIASMIALALARRRR